MCLFAILEHSEMVLAIVKIGYCQSLLGLTIQEIHRVFWWGNHLISNCVDSWGDMVITLGGTSGGSLWGREADGSEERQCPLVDFHINRVEPWRFVTMELVGYGIRLIPKCCDYQL